MYIVIHSNNFEHYVRIRATVFMLYFATFVRLSTKKFEYSIEWPVYYIICTRVLAIYCDTFTFTNNTRLLGALKIIINWIRRLGKRRYPPGRSGTFKVIVLLNGSCRYTKEHSYEKLWDLSSGETKATDKQAILALLLHLQWPLQIPLL